MEKQPPEGRLMFFVPLGGSLNKSIIITVLK
jgi:hypothetical protein